MNWSAWFAAAVAVQYIVAGVFDLNFAKYGYSLMWFCYAGANIGVILSMRGI